jgi:2-dehydro-3-deoxyglucarate aldolase/4-hydroxy-2-oxoheptanedioate aldolase
MSLRDRLRRGEALGVIWLALGSPPLAELAGKAAPDALVIDLQHGLWERQALEAAAGLARVPVLARVAELSAAAIATGLDAGAEGVIVPMVETAAEAARAVDLARYPPAGRRSAGGVRPLAAVGAYHRIAAETLVAVMVETAAGVDAAGAIAAVRGVDALFIGTGDLALSLGCAPGDLAHVTACAAVLAACQAAGTPCGAFTATAAEAAARRAQGYRLVVVENDIGLALAGFGAAVRGWRT